MPLLVHADWNSNCKLHSVACGASLYSSLSINSSHNADRLVQVMQCRLNFAEVADQGSMLQVVVDAVEPSFFVWQNICTNNLT